MDRRAFLTATGATLASTGLARGAEQAPPQTRPASAPAFAFASPPVLTNPAADSVTVTCAVTAQGTGWVEYGPTEQLGRHADGAVGGLVPLSDRVLRFRLTGLEPGQKYFYRVHATPIELPTPRSVKRGPVQTSAVGSFRTLDPAAPGTTFTVWNDTHENKATVARLAQSLRATPTDFLIWNGDVTNDIHREEQIVGQFLAPAGLPFADATPLFLGRGNHDVRGHEARKLPTYVSGPEGRYYYTFRHGPLAVLVMDTGEDKPDDNRAYSGMVSFAHYRTEQRAWLETAIADPAFASAPFRVAFLHIPLVWENPIPENWPAVWGDGIKGWVCEDGHAKWHDLLVRGRIDLIVSGHTHRHAWFPANATRPYGQLIGGGPKPEAATVITGRVEPRRMEIVMRDLDGKELLRQAFDPRPA